MKRVERLIERISVLRRGRALVEWLERRRIRIALNPDIPQKGSYIPYHSRLRSIELSPHPSDDVAPEQVDDLLVVVLCHEARHAMQDEAGYELYCHPDTKRATARWYNRILEADAHAFAAVMCLELAETGDDGPLEAYLRTRDRDVIRAAQKVYRRDPAHLHDGHVARAAFDQWFQSRERLEAYDDDADRRLGDAADLHSELVEREVILRDAIISLSFVHGLDDDSHDYLTLRSCPEGKRLPSLRDSPYWQYARSARTVLDRPRPPSPNAPLVTKDNMFRKKPYWEK